MEIFGYSLVSILVFLLLFVVISTWILMVSASFVGINGVTFGKALIANFAGAVLSAIATAVLTPLPVIGNIAGAVGGFLVTAWIIKEMFNTSYIRACITIVVSWVVAIVLLFLLSLLLFLVGFG